MTSQPGSNRVFMASDLLETVPEGARAQRAQLLIHQKTGKSWHVARVEPIRDEDTHEIKGFIAYTDQAR